MLAMGPSLTGRRRRMNADGARLGDLAHRIREDCAFGPDRQRTRLLVAGVSPHRVLHVGTRWGLEAGGLDGAQAPQFRGRVV